MGRKHLLLSHLFLKLVTTVIHHLKNIASFHQISGLAKAEHPLISLVDYSQVSYQTDEPQISWVQDFYTIGLKRNIQGKFKYGQLPYDFDEGLLSFVAPGQVVKLSTAKPGVQPSGLLLVIHPDFLWNTPLANKIKTYDFFGYAIHEALFLSEKEEIIITDLMEQIKREYHSNIDAFSQTIILSQIDLLLSYCERFYQRQFLTRKINNQEILTKLEKVLEKCFSPQSLAEKGIPSVQDIASELYLSPNYLGTVLKNSTKKTTKEHIQEKLLSLAKEKLSTTTLGISEIAYELGFEHSQSFNKFFKTRTMQTPLEFRAAFN